MAQTPLQFSQMYLLCVLFRLLILVVGLPTHRPVPAPPPSLRGTGEVRDLGSSSPSLSVCLLYHLAVLLFNIAPKVF